MIAARHSPALPQVLLPVTGTATLHVLCLQRIDVTTVSVVSVQDDHDVYSTEYDV